MLQRNPLAIAIISLSLSPIVFTNISYATITTNPNGTGMTSTYDNESITGPLVIPSSVPGASQVNTIELKGTNITWTNPMWSSSLGMGFPSAVSLAGFNGLLGTITGTEDYKDISLTVDKTSSIHLISTGGSDVQMIGIYTRTDTPDAVNTVNLEGEIVISSNDTLNSSFGIFAQNLTQGITSPTNNTGVVKVNLTNGAIISITNGNKMAGVYVDGRNGEITTDATSYISLVNNTSSSSDMTGLQANASHGQFDITNNGKISIDSLSSTGNKTGINTSAANGKAIVTNNGTITITGSNGTAINTNALTNKLVSTGDINVTGTNAKGIIVRSTDTTSTETQTIDLKGNITLDGTGGTALGSAVKLENQTQGQGIITYNDSNGIVSVTGVNTTQGENGASGFFQHSTNGGDVLIDIQDIKEINITTDHSMGIGAKSGGGTGHTQVDFTKGKITANGNNADGINISNANAGGNIIINQSGDISATGSTTAADIVEGIYANKGDIAGDVIIHSTGNIDTTALNVRGISANANANANGNITITLDANDDGNGNLTDKHISASSSGTGSAIGISAVSSGLNNNAEINIVRADYISTSGDTSTAIQGLASAGASVNINVGAINTISSNATGSNQATAINSSVVGGGNSSIMLSDDVKLIEVTGLGQAIKAITDTGTNTITLGNTKIIGGDTGGIYMESTAGIQELTSYADISAGNDRALWGTSSATTTIDNYNTITGYSDFSGTGVVTFNNNGNFVLQNFAGTNTKSTITNNFGTNGSFNNKGTISFSDKNFNGTTSDAVFNVNTFTNTGVINLTGKNPFSRNNFVGDTFTINGNYVSNGGSIYLNTLLDDATSNGGQGTSDLIVVNGSVTTGSGGATKLYITPTASSLYLGQVTVGDGIKVVQVNNSTSSDAFVLGRPLTSGIYEYTLHQGRANNNWYLSSFGLNPAVGAYLANQTAAVQMFQQSVFDRLISSSDGINNDASKNLFWMKTKMTHSSYDSIHDNLSNRSRTYTMQMGGDLNVWTLNNGGYFHLGVMGGYGDFKNTSRSEATGSKADGKVKGYTAGIYGTYFANQDTNLGLYVDMWSQMGWYRNEISGKAQIQTKKYNSTVWSNSIEFGYGLHLADSGEYQWLATPQLQLTYNHYDTDNLHDKNNLRVTNNNASGLDTRVGIRFHARGIKESLVEPFLEVNWLDTTAKNKLNFNGKAFKDGFSKDRFEAKVGLQGNINKQWSLSAQVGGQWGNNSFDSYQGQLNVNYKF